MPEPNSKCTNPSGDFSEIATARKPDPTATPAELIALPQWVCWRYENRDGKPTKVPIDAKSNGRLRRAKTNDPATWASHAEALAACERHPELAGVGFCFAPDDGLTGIDLDHVIDPDTGELKPEATEILERFQGTYIEVSPSGTGLRLFCYGKPGRCGKNVGRVKWCEVYSHPSSRYLTVTGNHWSGSATAVTEQQEALNWLHGRFMVSTGQEPVASKPGPSVALTLDDAALLDKARSAKNGAEFERLWSGDTSGHGGDDSAADLALCSLLAFWTGNDADRIDRLFRQSGLFRTKWDSKRGEAGTYGQMTVDKAIAGCRDTYSGRAAVRSEQPAQCVPPDDTDYLAALGSAEPPKTEGQGIQPPPWKPLDLDAMRAARLHPRCIVEYHIYADLAVVNAEGGTGKTTLLLYEAVHIALGLELWGCRVLNPGRTLFITAEDGEEILQARLIRIMDALGLNDWQRRKVADSVMFWDLSGTMARLAELDARGNLVLTELADRIVDTYRDVGLAQVIFDPAISFSPGERIINDGEQAIVTACRRIIRGLDCCVRLVHHTGKANARDGAIDQYAGRNGTALPDGCRMVTILANANRVNLARPEGFDLQPGETGFIMARAKLSFAPPQPNIWIRRRGWSFEYFIETPRNAEAIRDHDADKVADFLAEELHHGRRYTANTLEQSGKSGLSRSRLRAALATLETNGRVTPRDLPPELRQGGRKVYLHPLNLAATSGEVPANIPPTDTRQDPTSPTPTTSPPYRECNGGEVAAAITSPNSTTSPANIGEVPAKWRSSEELPQDTLANPPVEAKQATAPTLAKAQEINRQRIKESLAGMVELPGGGWMLKATPPPPVDTPPCPDISPDIPIAPPAESQDTTATCAAKRPDISRADPRRSAPPVCQPSGFYPFRYVTKCDKPTPIMPESGYGDPVGCSHCGQRWGGAA
jgi:RecA-family ATPase